MLGLENIKNVKNLADKMVNAAELFEKLQKEDSDHNGVPDIVDYKQDVIELIKLADEQRVIVDRMQHRFGANFELVRDALGIGE